MNLGLFDSGETALLGSRDVGDNPLKNPFSGFQLAGSDSSWERVTVHKLISIGSSQHVIQCILKLIASYVVRVSYLR